MTERNKERYDYINKLIVNNNKIGLETEIDHIKKVIKNYVDCNNPSSPSKIINERDQKRLENEYEIIDYIIKESEGVGLILNYVSY